MFPVSGKLATMIAAAVLLAHQGGWDEILMVVAPVAIFAGLLTAANRQARRRAEQDPHDGHGAS